MIFFKLFYELYKNLKYVIWECNFARQDRLISCCFWNRPDGNIYPEKSYDKYKQDFSMGKHKDWCLYFPFPKEGNKNGMSAKTCSGMPLTHIFYSETEMTKLKNIREGVKDLGVSLHHECHDSLELTQNRLLGAMKKEYVCNWDGIETEKQQKELLKFLINKIDIENIDYRIEKIKGCKQIDIFSGEQKEPIFSLILDEKRKKGILVKNKYDDKTNIIDKRDVCEFSIIKENDEIKLFYKEESDDVELFRRQYHELGCMKSALLNEISVKEKAIATQVNLFILWFSVIVTLIIAFIKESITKENIIFSNLEPNLIFFVVVYIIIFGLILTITYLSNSICLNEAKDALYICMGIDIDRRKEVGKEFRYIDVGERPG